MTFKIISTGWECRPFVERTLRSVESQTVGDYEMRIVVDPSSDGTEDFVADWCDSRDDRWSYSFTPEQRFSTPNQLDALDFLDPDPDDIVVWLDLDGDQFAHPNVLDNLLTYYCDDTLLTYGSFKCIPKVSTNQPARPFPPEVVAANSYRKHTRMVECCFNHLRTMKGRVANAIPQKQFQWYRGPNRGRVYQGGADYVFMIAGLELAGPRHKFIKEILCLYNHANPHADYLVRGDLSPPAVADFLNRPPLSPLEI